MRNNHCISNHFQYEFFNKTSTCTSSSNHSLFPTALSPIFPCPQNFMFIPILLLLRTWSYFVLRSSYFVLRTTITRPPDPQDHSITSHNLPGSKAAAVCGSLFGVAAPRPLVGPPRPPLPIDFLLSRLPSDSLHLFLPTRSGQGLGFPL